MLADILLIAAISQCLSVPFHCANGDFNENAGAVWAFVNHARALFGRLSRTCNSGGVKSKWLDDLDLWWLCCVGAFLTCICGEFQGREGRCFDAG